MNRTAVKVETPVSAYLFYFHNKNLYRMGRKLLHIEFFFRKKLRESVCIAIGELKQGDYMEMDLIEIHLKHSFL
jgi:hypothetical protein